MSTGHVYQILLLMSARRKMAVVVKLSFSVGIYELQLKLWYTCRKISTRRCWFAFFKLNDNLLEDLYQGLVTGMKDSTMCFKCNKDDTL